MAEMDETFANTPAAAATSHATGDNNNDSTLELRRWQHWRGTTTDISGTGRATRPIEIDGTAADTMTTRTLDGGANRQGEGPAADGTAGREGSDAPPEERETLWGHAVHEFELSPGDQVRVDVFACGVYPETRHCFPAHVFFRASGCLVALSIDPYMPEDMFVYS